MIKKVLSVLLATAMVGTLLAGCGSSAAEPAADAAEETVEEAAEEVEEEAAEAADEAEEAVEETAEEAADEAEEAVEDAAGAASDDVLQAGDYVIGLSNSYFGNPWRKNMVDAFTKAAESAKAAGYIKDYEIQNGDNTTNAQIAQINSFIMEGVDAICICAASATALNSTIQKALDAGTVVVSFDNNVDLDGVYKIDYDWAKFGKTCIDYIAERLDGKGNLVISHAVSGGPVDACIFGAMEEALKEYPDLKIVQDVYGEADPTKVQEELTKVMASMEEVDAVTTVGAGDAIGVVKAFEQSNREMPIIIGDNASEFTNWWAEQDGYETLGYGITPSVGAAAFWVALDVLNGYDVPMNMMAPFSEVTVDNLGDYAPLETGSFVCPEYTNEDVIKDVIDPAK